MAAKSGQVASLFSTSGSSTAATGEAMTQDGATFKYYITDRTKSWWDPLHVPVFYDDATEIPATSIKNIYYAAGFVELTAAASGAVTCDVYWFTPEALGGVYGFDFQPKAETKDITVMPSVLNSPTYWRSYLKTLMDWQGTAQRHFFSGRASKTVNCTNLYSDLVWTLREWGTPGNLRSVEYLGGTDQTLEVTYNAGTKKFTVQCATTGTTVTTTAAQIKAHVEADAVLHALVELTYSEASVAASKTVDCTNANSDLTWTWRIAGTIGNAEDIEYLVAGTNTPLTITYAAHKISVHVATGAGGAATSTAAQVAAAARATSAINGIVSVANAAGNDGSGVVEAEAAADFTGGVDAGSGVVEAKTAALMTGGRDQSTDFAKIGTQVLVRAYLNITTGSLEMVSGLAHLVGLPMNVKLEEVQEADLQFQGIGPLLYHTV